METLLVPVLIAWIALPLAVLIVPPVVAGTYRRLSAAAVALYLVALGLVGANWYAASEHMDWADRTGGEGSIFAGGEWLLAAVAAATASAWHVARHGRSEPVTR